MSEIEIHLPAGDVRKVAKGTKIAELAAEICPQALVAQLDGEYVDLQHPLQSDAELELLTFEDEAGAQAYRHSTSHIMAQAVRDLFPGTKLAIGPPIEDGFYYDFDPPQPFSEEDLGRIEARMREIIAQDEPFQRREVPCQQALELFEKLGEDYKVEILQELEDETVTLYQQGDFVDLCRGPHLPSTSYIKAFKLLSVAGAYWRGDESKAMLQRIYGVSFPTQEALELYLKRLEEAELRDHRRLAREMNLFSFHEEAGAGLVFYHPKGAILRQIIEDFLVKEHLARGYELVSTPHLLKAELWDISGHRPMGYPMYFATYQDEEHGVKPMNCNGHMLIYRARTRSYRELPIRFFELGTVYRAERSGTLHGLFRVRGFTQDDAHIFCTPEQLTGEITNVLEFATDMLRIFGFEEYSIYLSTRPEESIGDDAIWERATSALIQALEQNKVEYRIDPGGGVFYGPKIDIHIKDALGRLHQGATIQVDFNLPERFNLTYMNAEGKPERPALVHRVVLAGIERFLGLLLEHYAGLLPLWLAPVQVKVLPVSRATSQYAEEVFSSLREKDIRVELDDRSETVSYRVRTAEREKIPCIVVVGQREKAARSVTLRRRNQPQATLPLSEFIEAICEEIVTKALPA